MESNALRREARQRLARIQEATSEESQVAVDEFTSQYNLVLRARSEFHKSYDDWRRTEGGCDRSQAIAALGGFSLRFSELASTVRELPRATFLRPVGELLVEAAEREERSMRILRQAWRPFDALVYEGQDQERNTAGKLRRQAASGIQVLLVRYDISLQDFAR